MSRPALFRILLAGITAGTLFYAYYFYWIKAENQIITSYEVFEKRPNDSDLLVKAVDEHSERLGQVPDLVAADAPFHSPTQKAAIVTPRFI